MGGLPFSRESSAGAGAPAGDRRRTGRSAIAGVPAGCGVRAWHAAGFRYPGGFRSVPSGRLDVVGLRVLGNEDHRHDMDREARDQPAEGAAACWSCRVALLVRSWRYFLHKRYRLAQAVAGSLAGRPPLPVSWFSACAGTGRAAR